MIGSTRQVRVYAYREPVDMRKSFDTLTALVAQGMRRDVMSGEIFLFVSRSRQRSKVLFWDGTGLCLFSKRLAKGRFAAPWARPGDGPLVLTTSELALLLEGSELIGRMPLSPPAYTPANRVLRWG
ncbi:IS66 family insertion sequence element accessory protein TnpB [Polyangium jinanense]|uniref:IS66 family insertion sequence element accessory protein TnpB n=1 Tax=Polyangium jinanense TaxID=2829994 RepID=A0A9X4ATR0_9BACT|nr:IS66 family insertion sequence element accessory protein TnpB [Polyangium jinanense]MDC3984503.1 IS66 family insertion sequence element accessory protein TnpB [Polyangium jinanense]